jgi:hypothetical protein
MRTAATLFACLALLLAAASKSRAADATGSGIVIGADGHILTNAHVVERCAEIRVQPASAPRQTAVLIGRDQENDLAVLQASSLGSSTAVFRQGAGLRPGDLVVALGYPLSGLLARSANVSVGNVNALAGLGDDQRYFQISAPVQPGSSGGPLLDASGHLVGIVTAKLNATQVARLTGDIPQNVNFAIKAEVIRAFLDSKGIGYRTAASDQQLPPADIGDLARPFTVQIRCLRAGSSSMAVLPSRPSLRPTPEGAAPSGAEPTPDSAPELFKRGEAAFGAKNLPEALHWFRAAAEEGHSDAMNKVGIMYAMGQGVQADAAMAMVWFRHAAQRGNFYAMGNIGELYAKGDGVAKDCIAAREWLTRAAAGGLVSAQEYLQSGFAGLCRW